MKMLSWLFVSFFSLPQEPQTTFLLQAQQALKQALKSYRFKAMQISTDQEIFLSSAKTSIKSQGILNIKGKKFYLYLKGHPSSTVLFDGKVLWYQADMSEKTVFKLKNPPQISILTHWFNEKSFFDHFLIQQAQVKNKDYILQLSPKREIAGLKAIYIKLSSHITELRIVWEDLDNWQKYHFARPIPKNIPDKNFQFSIEGFQVITKEALSLF